VNKKGEFIQGICNYVIEWLVLNSNCTWNETL